MKKVRFLRNIQISIKENTLYKMGEEYVLDDKRAESFCLANYCEIVDKIKKPKVIKEQIIEEVPAIKEKKVKKTRKKVGE